MNAFSLSSNTNTQSIHLVGVVPDSDADAALDVHAHLNDALVVLLLLREVRLAGGRRHADVELGDRDLDAERELPAAPRVSALPPEPPRDPQMEKARRHIDDLLEQLKAAGKGGEATRILMRGYGETVDESRALYKQLKAILDQ